VTVIHLVVPAGIDDEQHPSGGNVFDRRLAGALVADGWRVVEHSLEGGWPRPDAVARSGLAEALRSVPTGALVVLDGLVASATPEVLQAEAGRLRLVVLVHAPLGDDSALPVGLPAGVRADVRRVEAAALSAAVAVLTTSRWTRRWLMDHYGLPADRVHVAVPGADPAPRAPGSRTGGELLCVAAVTPGKGHDVLLAALATLADLPWRCLCLGALDLAPEHAAAVRRQATTTGLAERVCFAGPRAGNDLDRAYATADVLVLASRAESYGLVVTEALAHGLPVIATAVGGVAEAVGHAPGGPPGCLVEPDDPGALAAALRGWLEDGAERDRLRRAALARARTLPRWSDTSRQVGRALAAVAS
jgi:glycosyltransferase involved in cell wall biosynthesis